MRCHVKILGPDGAHGALHRESTCPGLCEAKARAPQGRHTRPLCPVADLNLQFPFFGSSAWIHGSSLGHSLHSWEIRNADSSLCEPCSISLHCLTLHACPESLFSHNSGQGRFQLALGFLARQTVWLQGTCVEEGDTLAVWRKGTLLSGCTFLRFS